MSSAVRNTLNANTDNVDSSTLGSGSGNSVSGDNISSSESDRYSGVNGPTASSASQLAEAFANKDRRAACHLRILVVVLFLVATILVPTLIYYSTTNDEILSFEGKYDGIAQKVLVSVDASLDKKLGAMDALNIAVTSYAVGSQSTWPYVTIPDFDIKAANLLALADVLSVALAPLIRHADRAAYEQYILQNLEWIATAYTRGIILPPTQDRNRHRLLQEQDLPGDSSSLISSVVPFIWSTTDEQQMPIPAGNETDLLFPIWQNGAPPITSVVNYNIGGNPVFGDGFKAVVETEQAVFGKIIDDPALVQGIFGLLQGDKVAEVAASGSPISVLNYPVFDRFGSNATLVAVLYMIIVWKDFFTEVLPPETEAVTCVVQNECGQSFTFQITGQEAVFLGNGDLHDSRFDYLAQSYDFSKVEESNSKLRDGAIELNNNYCRFNITIYPTEDLYDQYVTVQPAIYTGAVAFAMFCIFLVAMTYDCVVQRRLKRTLSSAMESRAIVTSLFPANVQERLFEEGDDEDSDAVIDKKKNRDEKDGAYHLPKARLRNFLNDNPANKGSNSDGQVGPSNSRLMHNSKPIADLFPNCTVIFADIAGFTAWSSEREPAQVFVLLQTIFHFFDRIARKHGVFKVETIGDCYVAVTGLPEPQKDHALRMARFARECVTKVSDLVHKLETTLGPDTGELTMRFGLNSGPVTAGVLRGEKSRFQLFGDTVNLAALMENTGGKNRIHCTQSTANLLISSGKEQWITPRKDLVNAKGTGIIQTYWIRPTKVLTSSSGSAPLSSDSGLPQSMINRAQPEESAVQIEDWSRPRMQNRKVKRLVEWQTDILSRLLRKVVAKRNETQVASDLVTIHSTTLETHIPLDEMAEILKLPNFDHSAGGTEEVPNVDMDPVAIDELRAYVGAICCNYKENPFHNFDHAAHVTMSATKLLNRIVTQEDVNYKQDNKTAIASELHDYTFGITSDPLTQFAVIFCALIHDVDHRGVTNAQLGQENPEMAAKYKNRALAEQNSVDIAWDELMKPKYTNLQQCIFGNESELKRFRQLVVNLVMATDIFDTKMKELRNYRWEKAFHKETSGAESPEKFHYRATVVIEHIIQAADVAHTMQHWHIYTKWNERLFQEMMLAFEMGRSANNPALGWYKGELWFFDNYVIPLGKKLDECNVFGVASDEGLAYALANRAEWAEKGEKIVQEMVLRYQGQRNADHKKEIDDDE